MKLFLIDYQRVTVKEATKCADEYVNARKNVRMKNQIPEQGIAATNSNGWLKENLGHLNGSKIKPFVKCLFTTC